MQPDLWTEPGDRETFLRELFRGTIEFKHRGKVYAYVGVEERPDAMLGKLGRPVVEVLHQSPQHGFAPEEHEGWRSVRVILDPRGDAEGQKMAVEHDSRVGKPLALMRSLAESVNARTPATYWTISVNPITDSDEFWTVARRYRGAITEISFLFIAPNMLGVSDSYADDLKRMRDEENAQEVLLAIRNSSGNINPETRQVHQAEEYVSKGGGRSKIKSFRKTMYDSDAHISKINFDAKALSDLRDAVVDEVFRT